MVGPSEQVYNDKSMDTETPLGEPLSAKYKRSFAYNTIKDRLPVIIAKVVDYLCREKLQIVQQFGEPSSEEIKEVIGSFSKLRNELQTNKPIIPLTSSTSDVHLWNSCIEKYFAANGKQPRWFEASWLLAECYMYRRIRQAFEKSSTLSTFDPFGQQKRDAFISSLPAIKGLGEHLNKSVANKVSVNVKKELIQFLKVALWGNKCDLSISAGEKNEQKHDPIAQLESLEEYILVNDTEKVWAILSADNNPKSVDIVLDNSGFELFSDLCLADILVTHDIAATVEFHVKCMPWFVSDVNASDLSWTMEQLKSCMPELATRWQQYFDNGTWKLYPIEKSYFWTLPFDFNSMEKVDPDLFYHMQNSSLVIYKGDLNYRKLVGDRNLNPDSSFSEAVGSVPAPCVALRTLKADVVVGLQPGQAEQVATAHQNWMISGEFAVIQVHAKNQ